MVDLEADRKFFDMVEGAHQEQRQQQQNTVDAIQQHDYNNILIQDPLTNELIQDVQQLLQQVDIFQIWTQSDMFNPEEFLTKVHFNTSLNQFNQGIAQLKLKLKSIDNSDLETKSNLIV